MATGEKGTQYGKIVYDKAVTYQWATNSLD